MASLLGYISFTEETTLHWNETVGAKTRLFWLLLCPKVLGTPQQSPTRQVSGNDRHSSSHRLEPRVQSRRAAGPRFFRGCWEGPSCGSSKQPGVLRKSLHFLSLFSSLVAEREYGYQHGPWKQIACLLLLLAMNLIKLFNVCSVSPSVRWGL